MTEECLLTIHPAGAGSGKTYTIQTSLGKHVATGKVRPERIVAVTFTETAAAELVQRIREELVGKGMLEEALRLDCAYISTIHGFGRRILAEHAFEAGISPTLRMLGKAEERMLASKAIAASDVAALLTETLDEDGYRFDFRKKSGAEESFRQRVLKLTDQLRTIGGSADVDGLASETAKSIRAIYGNTEDGGSLTGMLFAAVHALLTEFPGDMSGTNGLAESAKAALWNDYRNLKAASRPGALDGDWRLWQKLTGIKTGTRPQMLPKEYRDMAKVIKNAAENLSVHPGPLRDAEDHAAKLLRAAADTLSGYSREKRKRGLLDFMDMLSLPEKFFAGEPDALGAFVERIDCLVVDEFQDTSPLQFALLWGIHRAGRNLPTMIVGDVKQAIMGFQNADERLLAELCRRYPTEPLEGNWRSSAPLMQWINLVGKTMFGEMYDDLAPEAGFESRTGPLEIIRADLKLDPEGWASYTVGRIRELLEGEESIEVWDKKLGKHRPVRGGDIAVIAYKNSRLTPYAEALRRAGIHCRLEENGWLETRIVQLALYALSYVADPGDRHAALYMAVTELGSASLEEGLTALLDGSGHDDAVLRKLDTVAGGSAERTLECLLDGIIAELDLYGTISRWPDAAESRANLVRLQGECREFMESGREAMASGGYYGKDAKTFIAWLRAKIAEDEKNNTQPGASIIDEDAVQLLTWHKSKGGEWPVVAVCGMDDGEFPRLPSTRVDYDDFSRLEKIMEQTLIRIHPKFASKEASDRMQADLIPASHENSKRLLYVALTRAREKVILEWPEYLRATKSKGAGTYWSEFRLAAKAEMTPSGISIDGTDTACRTSTISVKEPMEITLLPGEGRIPPFGRIALEYRALPTGLTPETVRPSSLHGGNGGADVQRRDMQYGVGLTIELEGVTDAMVKGSMLHRAFEVLSGHPERGGMLEEIVGCGLTPSQREDILRAVSEFDRWLVEELGVKALHPEMPLLTLDPNGSVVAGFADLVAETEDGLWVVDHKSDQVVSEGLLGERFELYHPQVRSYAGALATARTDKPVKGIVLNWFSFGKVSMA